MGYWMGPILPHEPLKAENFFIWKKKNHILEKEVKEIQNVGGTWTVLGGFEDERGHELGTGGSL